MTSVFSSMSVCKVHLYLSGGIPCCLAPLGTVNRGIFGAPVVQEIFLISGHRLLLFLAINPWHKHHLLAGKWLWVISTLRLYRVVAFLLAERPFSPIRHVSRVFVLPRSPRLVFFCVVICTTYSIGSWDGLPIPALYLDVCERQ